MLYHIHGGNYVVGNKSDSLSAFGYWLDRWMGWAPWSLIGGLIVGFAAGANNAWRAIRVYSEQADADRKTGGENRLP